MKPLSEAELFELKRWAQISGMIHVPDLVLRCVHMARASLKPEISEKEIVDHSQRFEKRLWAPAPAWQAGARWAIGKMKAIE